MYLSEFYQEFGHIIDTVALLLGGGFVVKLYHSIKGKGRREENVDQHIDALQKTSRHLKESIQSLKDDVSHLRTLVNDNSAQQESIKAQIDQLQKVAEDTQENTKAVQELGFQIERLIEHIDMNNKEGDDDEA